MKISLQHKNTIVSAINRQHNYNYDLLISFIESKFPPRKYLTSDHIICEDFNLNLLGVHQPR